MTQKRFDVVALGELLIDFTRSGTDARGNPRYAANPGGAPCNVLAMLRQFGRDVAFLGKVGRDGFGSQLWQAVSAAGIDVSGLVSDPENPTTLAFVHNGPDGERDFSFYRGADRLLREDELTQTLLADCRIFHFGTLSMTHPGVREATRTAARLAKESGALLSFDPNFRPLLWDSPDEMRRQAEWGLGVCGLAKLSAEELALLTGEHDPDCGAARLRLRFPGLRMLNVTMGADGSCCYAGGTRVFVPAFRLGETVDATGAGDCFCGCVLDDVLEKGLDDCSPERLTAMLRRANAAACLVTTRQGAFRSMPTPDEIDALLQP